MRSQGSLEVNDELWSLANGPDVSVKMYSGCISNGIRFHTKDRDTRRKTQNSGIVVEGDHENVTMNFYGYLSKVWEMSYIFGHRVVLFQCEWFNLSSGKMVNVDSHFTSIDVRSRWYKDDPFVLPNQVQQVFYVNDTKYGPHWQVVQRVQHRGIWDIPERHAVDVGDDEHSIPNDAFQQEEPTEDVPIVVENHDTHPFCRTELDPVLVPSRRVMSSENIQDKDVNDDFICDDEDDDETLLEYSDSEGDMESHSESDVDPEI